MEKQLFEKITSGRPGENGVNFFKEVRRKEMCQDWPYMFCTRERASSAVIKTNEKDRAKDRRSAREIAGLLAGRRFMERFRFKANRS